MNMEKQEKEGQLIDLVNSNPCIWNKSLDSYKNKLLQEKSWKSIAEQLDLSSKECEKLWKSLRSQFLCHQRKLKRPSGSSATGRPYFRHEQAMQFINDTLDSGGSYSNLPSEVNKGMEQDIDSDAIVDENEVHEFNVPVSPDPRQFERRKHAVAKRPRLNPVDAELLRSLHTNDNSDEFDAFGQLVAAKMRKIAHKDVRLFHETQNWINQLIHDAELKILDGESSLI